ncbi:MAG: hypothetical protein Q8K66_07545 [Sediminibacterium sp.]|nr:hypothetical protein [Sediminibacterium sp.]MDP3127980.1 hypothetical protein [Sediminibacterium sp.]
MTVASKEYQEAARTGKLPEASVKLRQIYSLCDELLQYGIKVTLNEEIIREEQ